LLLTLHHELNNCIATTYKLDNSSAGIVTTLQVVWLLKYVTKQCFQPQSNSNSGGGGVVEAEEKKEKQRSTSYEQSVVLWLHLQMYARIFSRSVLILLTKKCTIFHINTFFYLLHTYIFNCLSIIRESLCIIKLPNILKRNRLIYIYIYIRHNKIKHQMVLCSKLVAILKVFLNCNQCAINALYTIISTWIYVPWGPNPWLKLLTWRHAGHVTHNLKINHTVYIHNLVSLLVLQTLMKSKHV